jgi:phosphonate transport system ATP-binding protein
VSTPFDPADCIRAERLVCRVAGRVTLALPQFSVRAGERVALIGPNGAGKSTLLRCLVGLARPDEGRLQVLDTVVWRDAAFPGRASSPSEPASPRELRALRAEVGHVMQGLHLVQRLSALENVLIGALARVPGWRSWLRLYPAAEVQAADAALRSVGLGHRAATRSDQLSGGERQKLAIARMLVQQPLLILADEATASLDPQAANEVCQLLARAATRATLVSVVHHPGLLPLLADRVVGLRQGQVVFDLPRTEVDDARLAALYAVPALPASALTPAGDAAVLRASSAWPAGASRP